MNKDYKFNKSAYDKMEAGWPELDRLSRLGCECGKSGCEGPFTEENPMEMAVKCHVGSPVVVTYWDGWLYLSCSKCDKPVVKVPVSRSLL